jgi:hypothetical protein
VFSANFRLDTASTFIRREPKRLQELITTSWVGSSLIFLQKHADVLKSGSKHVHQFRSPNEFTFHALWLMCGMPYNADGTPNCLCQYCNGTPQDVISENFSNYHRPKRPTEHTVTMDPATINRRAVRTAGVVKRKAPTKRSAADPPIKFKDYTQKT